MKPLSEACDCVTLYTHSNARKQARPAPPHPPVFRFAGRLSMCSSACLAESFRRSCDSTLHLRAQFLCFFPCQDSVPERCCRSGKVYERKIRRCYFGVPPCSALLHPVITPRFQNGKVLDRAKHCSLLQSRPSSRPSHLSPVMHFTHFNLLIYNLGCPPGLLCFSSVSSSLPEESSERPRDVVFVLRDVVLCLKQKRIKPIGVAVQPTPLFT